MTSRKIITLFSLLICVCCKSKNEDPAGNASACQLSGLAYTTHGLTFTYTYNSNGQLISAIELADEGNVVLRDSFTYKYEANKITITRAKLCASCNKTPFLFNIFKLNSSGLPLTAGNDVRASATYVYDGEKLLYSLSYFDSAVFTYDVSSKNIIKVMRYRSKSDTDPWVVNFTYDDKPNPMKGIFQFLDPTTGVEFFSQNNVISSSDVSKVFTYTYNYNKQGLPLTSSDYDEVNNYTNVINFTYNCK